MGRADRKKLASREPVRKLAVRRETLRKLGADQLDRIAGGLTIHHGGVSRLCK